jgi:hypothetical protein
MTTPDRATPRPAAAGRRTGTPAPSDPPAVALPVATAPPRRSTR